MLSKNDLSIYNALITLRDVLFEKHITDTQIDEAISNSESSITTPDNMITVKFGVLGYDRIVLLKDNLEDPNFFTTIYKRGIANSLVVDETQSSKYLPDSRGDKTLWQLLTYELRNSVLLFECSTAAMYYYHEVVPLAVAMANGNKVYLIETGTSGKINDPATMALYQHVAKSIRDDHQPAYLRILLSTMFRRGNFGLVVGEEHSVIGCKVTKTSLGNMRSIPARYLKYAVSMSMTYATVKFNFEIPLLKPFIMGEEINPLHSDTVLSPLLMTSWIDEMLAGSLNPTSITPFPEPDSEIFHFIDNVLPEVKVLERLTSIETINGNGVKGLSSEEKLDILRREGLHYYCYVLSKLLSDNHKQVYMQDIAIIGTEFGYKIVVPKHEALVMSHDCIAHALVNNKLLRNKFNHSQAMCPLTQDYYMAGLSCAEAIKEFQEYIKQALYFRYTRYFPWDNLAVTVEDIRYFTDSSAKVPYINKLLDYNNVVLGIRFNELEESSMPLSSISSSVSVFGEPNKRINDTFQRNIKIPL